MARPVLVYAGDLTIEAGINDLGRRLTHEFGAIDVLVHCAGAYTTGKISRAACKSSTPYIGPTCACRSSYLELIYLSLKFDRADCLHKLFTGIAGRATYTVF